MNDRIGIRRLMTSLLVAVLGLVIVVGATGCASSDEELIRATITKSMDLLKNPTEETLSPYLEDSQFDMSSLEKYGIDPYEFLSHCFAKFDYSVDEVRIDGKEATASLTLNNVDLVTAAQTAAVGITSNLDEYNELLASENAEQEIMKVFMQSFYELVDSTEESVDSSAELTFTKDGDEWVVDKESIVAMVEKMYASIEI